MPIETPLGSSPYHSTYDVNEDYYRILFRPGVSVQVREMNDMQAMFQNQVESFADNIFKRGTIIDGCNFVFYNNYQYVKLLDQEQGGTPTIPSLYKGLFARNSSGVAAFITNYTDGFETDAPNLKAIYLSYVNGGLDGSNPTFAPGDMLTVYDSNNSIFSVDILNGGLNFSNSDVVVFSPAVLVRMSAGIFSVGDYLVQPSTGANVEIISVDNVTYANAGQLLLYVRPQAVHLANASANSQNWTLDVFEDIRDSGNTKTATIEATFGRSAQAQVITNGVGKITSMPIVNQGLEYIYPPEVSVRSVNNAVGISALELTAKNYLANVQIYTGVNAVGNGYAFSVSDGRIYQKGHMLRVESQLVIVDKFNNSPNNVSVGFRTSERIVNYNMDSKLLDNALGTTNETAPGADRLQMHPELVVMDVDEARANEEFFNIVEWSDGQPYKQNQVTQYSRLGDEMAQRTFDESGNYVIDTFQVSTMSVANTQKEGEVYTVAVDPGQAYIGGYKVQTLRNFLIDVQKGTNTKTANGIVSLNYGYYVRVNELGGLFQFSTGDIVGLYDTAKQFLSNTTLSSTGNVAPVGNKIGEARIRSLVYENGPQGDANTVNRLFLFDVKMYQGQNFSKVRSVAYGANVGIADIVLYQDPTTSTNVAIIEGVNNNRLLFNSGAESLKNSNNVTYVYRTIDQTKSFANNGTLTKSIATTPDEFYPYSATLSDAELRSLYVVPIGNNLVQYSPLTGNLSCNTTSPIVLGLNGANFLEQFNAGDWINFKANAVANTIMKILSIPNSATMVLSANAPFANSGCEIRRAFPKNVPIPFGSRQGLTANVNSAGNILTLRLAHSNGELITTEGIASVNTAIAVNIERRSVTSETKIANRNRFVKIRVANNAGGTQGPWCLGVPDIFRLRKVYTHTDATVNTSSYDVTHKFYIDHNQTANYYDLGWLAVKPRTGYNVSTGDYLLVEFDYAVRSDDGYFDTVSYTGTANAQLIANLDSQPLGSLGSSIASLEVPEVYTYDGKYYDLLNQFDFRPAVSNTVAPSITVAAAPVNPAATLSFGNTADPVNDKKFPLPDSLFRGTFEQYMGRVDSVFIAGDKGNIYVLKGIPDTDPRRRLEANHPKTSLKLQTITVPPYPNVTDHNSDQVSGVMNTNVFNERAQGSRLKTHAITPILSSLEFQLSQPMVYTMEDIANLERRIKDLEYYQALSALETNIANKIIPSSVDPTITRFKYGFFADDFSTQNFSDLSNPQYAASLETEGGESWGVSKNPLDSSGWANSDSVSPDSTSQSPTALLQRASNRCVPPKFSWIVPHTIKNLGYIKELCLSQNNATETIPKSNCVPQEVQYVGSADLVSNAYFYTKENDPAVTSEEKTNYFVFDSKSGQATIWFDMGTRYSRIDVYKGNGIIASSNATANLVQTLSSQDKIFLTNNNFAKPWYQLSGVSNLEATYLRDDDDPDYISGVGKIQFSHDPSTGVNYSVVVDKGNSLRWKYLMEYPLTTAKNEATTVAPCAPNPPTENIGSMILRPWGYGAYWSCSKNFKASVAIYRLLWINAYGLKPTTQHHFYLDGIDCSEFCYRTSGSDGAYIATTSANGLTANMYAWLTAIKGLQALVSDASGRCEFMVGLDTSQNAYIDSVIQQQNSAVWGSSGYSVLALKGPGSLAIKLIAQRNKNQPLPFAPAAAA